MTRQSECQEYFEFLAELADGRQIYVEGYAKVLRDCDCREWKHNHLDDVEFIQMVQEYEPGTNDSKDITRDKSAILQIEDQVLEKLVA